MCNSNSVLDWKVKYEKKKVLGEAEILGVLDALISVDKWLTTVTGKQPSAVNTREHVSITPSVQIIQYLLCYAITETEFILSIADVIWNIQHHGEQQIIAICISPHV